MSKATLTQTVGCGLVAGAASATALNLVTSLDMTLRGRPSSTVPEQLVDKLASESGVAIPGDDTSRSARRIALGALSGMATGASVAVLGKFDAPLRAECLRRLGPVWSVRIWVHRKIVPFVKTVPFVMPRRAVVTGC